MSQKKINTEENKTFPICSKWNDKYYYCMFAPNDSYVLRFLDKGLPSFSSCADNSVITPENEIISFDEFWGKLMESQEMTHQKVMDFKK